MSKKNHSNIREQYGEGKRKSVKEVNQDKYLKLFEFLMLDPLYREMPDKAKVLYSYLKSKMSYFEKQTEDHKNGVKDTKSYLDENNEIYILADNTELTYILNTSEPTLISLKSILYSYGLLDEVQQKGRANRIYVLDPPVLSEAWAHIPEINKLRAEKEEARKERYMKEKAKRKEKQLEKKLEKIEKKNALKNLSHTKIDEKKNALNNLSHNDLENLSHNDLNNLSEIELKDLKSNSKDLKSNLSSLEEEGTLKKAKFKNEFTSDEIKEAYSFIAPQMIDTFNELNLDLEYKDRIVCYMSMRGMKYFSSSEYRTKRKHLASNNDLDKKGNKISDLALYIVNGLKMSNRETKNDDRRAYKLEEAKKQQEKLKDENHNVEYKPKVNLELLKNTITSEDEDLPY